ncbi:MAG: 2,3-bisphosphoglycerate-independent phosphoglycerate mutase [Gammaproteobacteria bacterium]|nr:2,3-bisphosphoglycerate-independent phosphoglycerate mutase [Gammaproteobacteria bacterium]
MDGAYSTAMTPPHQPLLLIILDGWGYSDNTQYNAIHNANKPVWDRLWENCPHMLISASGIDVGLPNEQMGNSEVGHMHLGAGRVIDQELTRIGKAIEDGHFFENGTLLAAFGKAASGGKAVHILGLLSPGGVHSHEDHVLALMEMAARSGVRRVYVHAFLDGRDTPPKSAANSIQRVMMKFTELGRCGRIASIIGRYFAMDRNKNWGRTEAAYNLIVDGLAMYEAADPLIALDQAYHRNETDEFMRSTAIIPRDQPRARIEDGDVIVFANFRADRARQLTQAFIEPFFTGFKRARVPAPQNFITMTSYSDDFQVPVVYPPSRIKNSFGEYIAGLGIHQLRIAETEKYAHVTFFFNGGDERVFQGEDRILIPSPHVATYDQKPEMSAAEVTDELIKAIESRRYGAIICNFANADMVGHTGVFEAAVKAIETLDHCLGRIEEAARAAGMEILITADHGNAEKMREVSTKKVVGQTHTAHTRNPVPLVYIGREATMANDGTLSDIAPTMLSIMGLAPPAEMTGRALVIPKSVTATESTETGQEPIRASA